MVIHERMVVYLGKRFLLFSVVLFLLFSASACSSEESYDIDRQISEAEHGEDMTYQRFDDKTTETYDKAFNELTAPVERRESSSLAESILRSGYQFYATVRSLAPYIFVGSIAIGILIMVAARMNKGLRRLGLYGFVIGIPVLLLIVVYGIGLLNDTFLY